MIKKVEIENYKSLENLSLELGRFNVLIGENGCGKTNILESLVFAAAGMNGNVVYNNIASRGGRMSDSKSFRSGFEEQIISEAIKIKIFDETKNILNFDFNNDNKPFSNWVHTITINGKEIQTSIQEEYTAALNSIIDRVLRTKESDTEWREEILKDWTQYYRQSNTKINNLISENKPITSSFAISDYIIYAPENFFLRNVNINEPYIDPAGSRGEGLLRLIKIIKKEKPEQYQEIINNLYLIDWFESVVIDEDINADREFTLSDKYLEDGLKSFDIRNANEGFLFVLFYLTIFISDYTPKFFAIDNIDTALNPKLCSKLISVLTELAKKHDKQVIITTHNPSVLDGLDLNDDEQRLFVVARTKSGRTGATRIEKKPAINGTAPVRLSEQFLRGYIGGLPKNF